jgi:uncharacterized protein
MVKALAMTNADPNLVVPKRPFGKTGVSVAKLCLGGASVVGTDSRLLLEGALRYDIDCWEFTAFTGRAFGDYFKAHPGVRERVFLTGKTKSTVPSVMQEHLDRALVDNSTSVIDWFAVHGVDDVAVLTDDVRRWAEQAKQAGKIRFFGFCTHKRAEGCLERVAGRGERRDLDWIDGIQAFHNYRTQAIESTEVALRKCHAQGIAIFAVKSMGLCAEDEATIQGLPLARNALSASLVARGLSFEQAKLKLIWQSPCLTSVCSLMPSAEILRANAAAAIDERPLDGEVTRLLTEYAHATGPHFCRRCASCEAATQGLPVPEVMEMLMYARSYGATNLKAMAVQSFARIPAAIRARLSGGDFAKAEAQCPQRMPIARLMKEACLELDG